MQNRKSSLKALQKGWHLLKGAELSQGYSTTWRWTVKGSYTLVLCSFQRMVQTLSWERFKWGVLGGGEIKLQDHVGKGCGIEAWATPIMKNESHSVLSDSLQPHRLYSPWNSPGQNTGVGSRFLCQGIFPTQGLNSGLPHCRWILYQLSHQACPKILEWVAYPFSQGIFPTQESNQGLLHFKQILY